MGISTLIDARTSKSANSRLRAACPSRQLFVFRAESPPQYRLGGFRWQSCEKESTVDDCHQMCALRTCRPQVHLTGQDVNRIEYPVRRTLGRLLRPRIEQEVARRLP